MSQIVSVIVTCHDTDTEPPVMLVSLGAQREYKEGVCTRTGGRVLFVAGGYLQKDEKDECNTDLIIASDGPYKGILADRDYITFLECPKLGSPGHHTRGPAIALASGDWIVLTNMDNYFVSGWRHRIEEFINNPRIGMVYWDTVNNLWRWNTQGGTKIERGKCDLSCAAVRADIAKSVGFPYTEYDGDFDYLFECKRQAELRGYEIKHLDEILSVHC